MHLTEECNFVRRKITACCNAVERANTMDELSSKCLELIDYYVSVLQINTNERFVLYGESLELIRVTCITREDEFRLDRDIRMLINFPNEMFNFIMRVLQDALLRIEHRSQSHYHIVSRGLNRVRVVSRSFRKV